ncbi:1-deoxy-D-xylulose-5-phosphate synthase [Pyrinomonas methylaliphatogenes]|jgi:1-deoxy-D-xylulose-5-phosphate synthase|uniref:1-deoxy-D-xylulose-5-phosphate synthase n=1 Tax=Pyrinomonas methylaliphatogenes TaxID=454194 RepID=A0A0B6X0G3_9BACT|nr:1-deoxy-D-xylulose-5-phosphate synthase [Pyrinomonas methylaliphatogenes]MBX5479961.1 1-deoxy-D-xylulose-5-phosphate synthase [Pyrinomonas methylaliphatogenes]CDM66029.1 1-deoxy-D-xylulose-5-phosphate synthase [Pyrinomonas methylaliphatogenes]
MELLQTINSPEDLRRLPLDLLPKVAQEVRQYIIETMSRIGGHTGASLGAVELAVALHYAFDTPRDRLVWDVGHQAYAHKILTGRRDQFPTIRQYGGLSGFLRRDESEYDTFGAGHASTSISAALGMAIARDRKGENYHVCAIIGDASLPGGMAMEAINQAGHLKTRLIVLLNDNEMSIAPSVGALTGYLNRIREAQGYHRFKDEIGETLRSIPGVGERLHQAAKTVKDAIAAAVLPGALVNELGFKYIGYIDGHDTTALVRALREAQQIKDGPVIVHALTVKGKGYPPAEKNRYKWHASGPFDISTGAAIKSAKPSPPTYTSVFSNALCELMAKDERIVAITAAMPDGTGVDQALEKFPGRAFDVGIAEQHAVTFAAGLACEGLRPVAAIYSTFLQRAFDQIVHDVCIQNLHVVFAMDRAGIVGADGPTHHGLLDIAYMRIVPNMVVMAPKDEAELRDMLLTAIEHTGPICFRYPRGAGVGVPLDREPQLLEIGKAEILRDGGEVALLAYGSMVHPSLRAAEQLAKEGIETTVVNARFAKPLDAELILALARTKRLIVTVEEAYLAGGFGSAVMELLEENGLLGRVRLVRMGVPDRWVTHGDQKLLLAKYGLDADGIYSRVKESWEVIEERRVRRKRFEVDSIGGG